MGRRSRRRPGLRSRGRPSAAGRAAPDHGGRRARWRPSRSRGSAAPARHMALSARRAGDRVPTRAAPGLAVVRARATAAVIAGRALWLHRVGAHAGRTVALANVVALIEHRADHGVPAGTLTRL